MSQETDFLSRWSQRKQASRQDAEPEAPAHEAPAPVAAEELEATAAESALLTAADLPSVETLTATSDVSGFLAAGVSAALKKQALRQLFHQPEFNVRCPLDEYAEDYSQLPTLSREAVSKASDWAKKHLEQWLEEPDSDSEETNTNNQDKPDHDLV